MTKQNNAVILDGKEINLSDWLTTVKEVPHPNPNKPAKKVIEIKVDDYSDLGFVIRNLVGVCATALYTLQENGNFNEFEKANYFGANLLMIQQVLTYTAQLVPHGEFELLSKLQNSKNATD